MNKKFLSIGSLLGALSVALGAFGAHSLKAKIPAEALSVFETGVRYQFYHVIALLLVVVLMKTFSNRWMHFAGYFFIAGIVLFSGSLYIITFLRATDHASWLKFAGIFTPLGGLFLIAGWLMLFWGVRNAGGEKL